MFYYESESGGLSAELDKRLRINENILRWLTVADNPIGVPADKIEGENAPVVEVAPPGSRRGDD